MTIATSIAIDVLTVRPLDVDPVLTALGYDPRSVYPELFWLPIIGPTSLWAMRRLVTRLEIAHGADVVVDVADLAMQLGVGNAVRRTGNTRNGPLLRGVDRLTHFGLAVWDPDGTLAVPAKMPPLTANQRRRLPDSLARAHDVWPRGSQRHPS